MARSAAETITFLLTDVEGSTRLLRRLRGRYGEVLSQHQRLLRAAFVEADGEEIDTQGDSFLVAFRRPRDAVLAAVAAQRALAANEWPDGVEVRVRMGIHTGQAEFAEGRYLGLAVHRTARIAAAAHGGQVLLSQTTLALLEADEEEIPGFGYRDLGEQNLKDFDRPVALVQVEAPGLAADFPRLRLDAKGATGAVGSALAEELAEAAESALRRGFFRGRRLGLLAGGAAVLLALIAAAVTAQLVRGEGETLTPRAVKVTRNSLVRIDPATNTVAAAVSVGTSPSSVAVVGDSIWTLNAFDETMTIYRPATGAKQTTTARTPTAQFLIADGDSGAWVTSGDSTVINRIDTTTVEPDRTFDLGEIAGPGIVAADSLWIAPSYLSALLRIHRATGKRQASIDIDCERPGWFAQTPESIWISCYRGDSLIEVRKSDNVVRKFPLRGSPTGIAFGFDFVWVATETDGRVRKIDPRDGVVDDVIDLGGGLASELGPLAAGAGAVWVAARGNSTVYRIDPKTAKVTPVKLGDSVPPVELVVGLGSVWAII